MLHMKYPSAYRIRIIGATPVLSKHVYNCLIAIRFGFELVDKMIVEDIICFEDKGGTSINAGNTRPHVKHSASMQKKLFDYQKTYFRYLLAYFVKHSLIYYQIIL